MFGDENTTKKININANEKIATTVFDEIGEFKNDLARVKVNNKWGFINRLGGSGLKMDLFT